MSVKLRNPQFEGQTKTKLGNTEIRSFVERATNDKLAEWLEEHPSESKAIVTKSTQAANARMAARQARDLTRRKSLLESSRNHAVDWPAKLAGPIRLGRSTKDDYGAAQLVVEHNERLPDGVHNRFSKCTGALQIGQLFIEHGWPPSNPTPPFSDKEPRR